MLATSLVITSLLKWCILADRNYFHRSAYVATLYDVLEKVMKFLSQAILSLFP